MTLPIYTTNQVILIVVVSVCLVLSTCSIGLRFVARRVTVSILGWDDWFALVAWIFSFLTNIFIYICIRAGLGQHVGDLSKNDLLLYGLSFWLQELSWTTAMGAVVLSMLLFYRRLFPVKVWLRRSVYVIASFTICWTISCFLVLVFQCTPVSFFWSHSNPTGTCIEQAVFYFANGTMSMVTVFVVLLLPTPVLWKLQISVAKRMGLIVPFAIGLFVCAMSIARLIVLREIDAEDMPWTLLFPGMWSCVECNIGVVSACIPSLTGLFRHLVRQNPDGQRPPEQIRLTTHIHSSGQERSFRGGPFTRLDADDSNFLHSSSNEAMVTTSITAN